MVAITERANFARHILTWLSILPRSAAAKMGTGDVVYAEFSPDHERLFDWGYREVPEREHERVAAAGVSLIVVDVMSGAIVARGPAGQLIERLVTSPDGQSVYVTGPVLGKRLVAWTANSETEEFDSTYFLNRLDANSLDLLASRTFERSPWVAVGHDARTR